MKHKGLTLIELLTCLTIFAITFALAFPGFSRLVQKSHTDAASQLLGDAINLARNQAVFRNQRTVLQANHYWHMGWIIFVDQNNDGAHDADEPLIQKQSELKNVRIKGNGPVATYISFIGTGEGRKSGAPTRGAFITGTITVCSEKEEKGVKLVLNRGGRLRSEKLNVAECSD